MVVCLCYVHISITVPWYKLLYAAVRSLEIAIFGFVSNHLCNLTISLNKLTSPARTARTARIGRSIKVKSLGGLFFNAFHSSVTVLFFFSAKFVPSEM